MIECLSCMKNWRKKTIKLEKYLLGDACEKCRKLSLICDKYYDRSGNICIGVGCSHKPICKNALELAERIKEEKKND